MDTNVFAGPAANGLSGGAPPGYVDIDFTYPYDVVLTALQVLSDQNVSIHNDSDFVWRAIVLATFTGTFKIRFSDSQGYYLSQNYVNSANFLVGGQATHYPIFPEIVFPAGGKVGIDITDLSNATNTIQLLLRGCKRYKVPA